MARRPKKKEDKPPHYVIQPGRLMAMEMLDDHGIGYDELTPDQHDRLAKELAEVLEEDDKKPQEGSGKDSEKRE